MLLPLLLALLPLTTSQRVPDFSTGRGAGGQRVPAAAQLYSGRAPIGREAAGNMGSAPPTTANGLTDWADDVAAEGGWNGGKGSRGEWKGEGWSWTGVQETNVDNWVFQGFGHPVALPNSLKSSYFRLLNPTTFAARMTQGVLFPCSSAALNTHPSIVST
ncbi:hypothetical protein BT69DRAFT_597304 [Atractiella rhizophila]|nr:hypothetical protein BT69DRAFT_597304 [Atractiella rhizophila]